LFKKALDEKIQGSHFELWVVVVGGR
jgi:hypothetical protein